MHGGFPRGGQRLLADQPLGPSAMAGHLARIGLQHHVEQNALAHDIVNAIGLVCEIGDFARFGSARQLKGYRALVTSEHSSGNSVRRGSRRRAKPARPPPPARSANLERLAASQPSAVARAPRPLAPPVDTPSALDHQDRQCTCAASADRGGVELPLPGAHQQRTACSQQGTACGHPYSRMEGAGALVFSVRAPVRPRRAGQQGVRGGGTGAGGIRLGHRPAGSAGHFDAIAPASPQWLEAMRHDHDGKNPRRPYLRTPRGNLRH